MDSIANLEKLILLLSSLLKKDCIGIILPKGFSGEGVVAQVAGKEVVVNYCIDIIFFMDN